MRPRLPSKLELRELAINHSGELVILLNCLEILRVNRAEQIHNPLEPILRNLLKIVGASVERREIILERTGRSSAESALQLGSGILELILKHSNIVLKIADLD